MERCYLQIAGASESESRGGKCILHCTVTDKRKREEEKEETRRREAEGTLRMQLKANEN